MNDLVAELQATLAHEIPITQHLGITVALYDGECLILKAPFVQNINHKATAFAGSLNALLTLAGWGLLWLILKERNLGVQIVIQESVSSYLRPVTSDFSARCCKPDALHLAHLETMLRKRGKARVELTAEIQERGVVAVSFKGRYVAFLNEGVNKGRAFDE
jgi:thioesterase domain-containing protein